MILQLFYEGAYAGLALALLLALIRLIRGPSLADRVVALDLIAIFAAATIALAAITTGRSELIIVAIVLSLLMFMGTVAFAMYLERKGRTDAE
jgi:multicomponent Na+:H+ antiporter subunit F